MSTIELISELTVSGLRMRVGINSDDHGYDTEMGRWYGTCNLTVEGRDVCFHTYGDSPAEVMENLTDEAQTLGATDEQITLATANDLTLRRHARSQVNTTALRAAAQAELQYRGLAA